MDVNGSTPFGTPSQFDSPVFPAGTEGVRYSSLGGFLVEYHADSPIPVAGTDYAASTPGMHDAAKVIIGFDTPAVFQTPGLAYGPEQNLTPCPPFGARTPCYTKDISHDFWAAAGPGVDPGDGGTTDGFGSKFLVFDKPLRITGAAFMLKEPVLSGNPQFKQGQSIRVAFTLTDSAGNAIPNAIARLSILRISPTPFEVQPVLSKNNVNADNLFSSGTSGGLYTYTVDSSFLSPGTQQFTIFSDSFAPRTFNVTVIR